MYVSIHPSIHPSILHPSIQDRSREEERSKTHIDASAQLVDGGREGLRHGFVARRHVLGHQHHPRPSRHLLPVGVGAAAATLLPRPSRSAQPLQQFFARACLGVCIFRDGFEQVRSDGGLKARAFDN